MGRCAGCQKEEKGIDIIVYPQHPLRVEDNAIPEGARRRWPRRSLLGHSLSSEKLAAGFLAHLLVVRELHAKGPAPLRR